MTTPDHTARLIQEIILQELADARDCEASDCQHLIDDGVTDGITVFAFTTTAAPALARRIAVHLADRWRQYEIERARMAASFSASQEARDAVRKLETAPIVIHRTHDGQVVAEDAHIWHTWRPSGPGVRSAFVACSECGAWATPCDDGFHLRPGSGLHPRSECARCRTTPICHAGMHVPHPRSDDLATVWRVRPWTAVELALLGGDDSNG